MWSRVRDQELDLSSPSWILINKLDGNRQGRGTTDTTVCRYNESGVGNCEQASEERVLAGWLDVKLSVKD